MTSDVPVAGLVLAGGASPSGTPEALVEHAGQLLVERAVRTAAAVCDPVLVVLGAGAVEVWRTADLTGATVLADADWAGGTASGLRTGLDGLRGWPGRVDAVLVQVLDRPGTTPAVLARLAALAGPDAWAVATHDGVRTHPVLLGRAHWGAAGGTDVLTGPGATEVDCTDLAVPPA